MSTAACRTGPEESQQERIKVKTSSLTLSLAEPRIRLSRVGALLLNAALMNLDRHCFRTGQREGLLARAEGDRLLDVAGQAVKQLGGGLHLGQRVVFSPGWRCKARSRCRCPARRGLDDLAGRFDVGSSTRASSGRRCSRWSSALLARLARLPGRAYPRSITYEASKHLERLVAEMSHIARRAPGSGRTAAVKGRIAHAGGTVEALREVGAISAAEASEWFSVLVNTARVDQSPREVSWEPPLATSSVEATSTLSSPITAEQTAFFSGDGFCRLLPGPLTEKRKDHLILRVVALEEYDNECLVHWYVREVSVSPDRRPGRSGLTIDELSAQRRRDVSLTDDVATVYALGTFTAFADGHTLHGRQHFTPAPPSTASRVTFTFEDDHFSFLVPGR
jgi:hypothetical protein